MKKILIGSLSLLLVFIFFCVGCGSYVQNGSLSDSGDETVVVRPKPDDQQKEDKFTVELVNSDGSRYIPPYVPGRTVKARWTAIDGSSIHEATFNDDGIAELGELDGDYKVTLVDLADNVTYNPQGYSADNKNKHTVIEILTILGTTHSDGSNINDVEAMTTIDVSTSNSAGSTYRAIIDSPWNGQRGGEYSGPRNEKFEGIVFYQLKPTQSGWYSVESWVDVSSNEVNPILEYYLGSELGGKYWDHTTDSGGAASTYTKNFRFEVQLTKLEVGNVWAFGIHVESKNETYPILVDFTVKYEGTHEALAPNYTVVEANGPFDGSSTPAGTFEYNYKATNSVLVGSRFKLNKADGFYHLYDEKQYADNGGYGPVLYAKITKPSEVLYSVIYGFTSELINLAIEYRDPFNYNVTIYKDYNAFINTYSGYCNSDGVHPVNEELKLFLQEWSIVQAYFYDGSGFAESGVAETGVKLVSSFEDQWLFGCGYYI